MRRVHPRNGFRSARSTARPAIGCASSLVDEETREPVEGSDKARGYEIGKGQFLLVEDQELEAIEIESTHTIDIDSFVPRSEIDRRFFDTPYYITPNEPVGQEAFAVIREAMRSKALVALARTLQCRWRIGLRGHLRWRRLHGACGGRGRPGKPAP
jgi:Ku protein